MLVFCSKISKGIKVFRIIANNSVFTLRHKHKIPNDMTLLMFGCIQKRKLLQERRKTIEHWMISEKASRSYNTTGRTFSSHGDLSSLLWWIVNASSNHVTWWFAESLCMGSWCKVVDNSMLGPIKNFSLVNVWLLTFVTHIIKRVSCTKNCHLTIA